VELYCDADNPPLELQQLLRKVIEHFEAVYPQAPLNSTVSTWIGFELWPPLRSAAT
jgi:hypothetical protein